MTLIGEEVIFKQDIILPSSQKIVYIEQTGFLSLSSEWLCICPGKYASYLVASAVVRQ